jgi:hypothetical protein
LFICEFIELLSSSIGVLVRCLHLFLSLSLVLLSTDWSDETGRVSSNARHTRQLNEREKKRDDGDGRQRANVRPQVPVSGVGDVPPLENLLASHQTNEAAGQRAETRITELVDGQDIGRVPEDAEPLKPPEETGHTLQIDEKPAEQHHCHVDADDHDERHACNHVHAERIRPLDDVLPNVAVLAATK